MMHNFYPLKSIQSAAKKQSEENSLQFLYWTLNFHHNFDIVVFYGNLIHEYNCDWYRSHEIKFCKLCQSKLLFFTRNLKLLADEM